MSLRWWGGGSPGWALAYDNLGQAGDEEVVWKSLDAAGSQLSSLAAERTGELAIVGVLAVGGLGQDVALDAVLAERMQTRQTLGTPVGFQTDLADEELVVDLLRQASAVRTRRSHREQFVTD